MSTRLKNAINSQEPLEYSQPSSEHAGSAVEVSPDQRFLRFGGEVQCEWSSRCYYAFDNVKRCDVAWNVMPLQNLTLEKKKALQIQLQRVQMLKHPNIVQCKAAWIDDQKQVAVKITDRFEGQTSMHSIKSPTRRQVRQWSLEILSALAYLHSQKPPILVKCLTTDNIIVDHGVVKLAEYGVDSRYVHLGSFSAGKEFYSPEMFIDQLSPSVDVYSFGLCLLEIVTQERPYTECSCLSITIQHKLRQVLPQSLNCIQDAQVKDLILQCLRNCDERPPVGHLMSHEFFTDADTDVDHFPVITSKTPGAEDVLLNLPLVLNDGTKLTVEMNYNMGVDTPDLLAKQLSEEFGLPSSQLKKLTSDIRKLVVQEGFKPAFTCDQLMDSFKSMRRKTSLLEMEPVESTIPVSIKLMLPDFAAPCKIDFSYVLNIDKPEHVALDLIREFRLPLASKTAIEEEIKRLIRTKQKVNLGVQTSLEDLTTHEHSECSSTHAEGHSEMCTPSDSSSCTSDFESPDFVRPKRERRKKKHKLSNKKQRVEKCVAKYPHTESLLD